MNDALYIAATGMQTQQKSVDTIANNLANVNTPGFKRGKVSFEDLVYRGLRAGQPGAAGAAVWQGSGVGIATLAKVFAAGEIRKTDQPLDLAIDGVGFVEVTMADGTSAYSRGGTLTIDRDGLLATAEGYVLKPGIHVGSDVAELTIQADGRVLARAPGQTEAAEVGRIDLVRFSDTDGLAALGGNLYRPSDKSGDAIYGKAGEDGMGRLAQGAAEASNVRLIDEMVGLMAAQRAYESSVKVIQAADEMLAMSNNLRK
jgi:flagellar basal-body rod protein FlgG